MSEVIKAFYNNHKAFGINSLRRRKIASLAEHALLGKRGRVLDVGCTTGYVSSPLKAKGHYVVGIDIAEKAIIEAARVLDEAYVVDIEQYPWPPSVVTQPYDLIIVSEVIEHVFNQAALLGELKKMLAPGGYILITTPNLLIWSERIKMLLGIYENTDQGHIRMLSYRNFLKLCKETGFSVIAENHVWKPHWCNYIDRILSPNIFAYQIVVLIQPLS